MRDIQKENYNVLSMYLISLSDEQNKAQIAKFTR